MNKIRKKAIDPFFVRNANGNIKPSLQIMSTRAREKILRCYRYSNRKRKGNILTIFIQIDLFTRNSHATNRENRGKWFEVTIFKRKNISNSFFTFASHTERR